jgi:hypothetical protein
MLDVIVRSARLASIALLLGLTGVPAPANPILEYYFEFVDEGVPPLPIPPVGSHWLEYFPVPGTMHALGAYEDNLDGVMSEGDWMWLDGTRFHLNGRHPSYEMTVSGGPAVYIWFGGEAGGNPTGRHWMQVHPQFGAEVLITSWMDDGDGVVGAGDDVGFGGEPHLITRAGLVAVCQTGPTAVERGTWGRIKSFFGGLF